MKEKRIVELFHSWDQLKIKIHLSKKVKYFKQGEVWWCNMGQNVGGEARTAVVSQIKILSSFRLVSRQDKLEKEWYEAIRARLKSLYIDAAALQ